MHKTRTAAAGVLLFAALTACGTTAAHAPASGRAAPLTARSAYQQMSRTVTSMGHSGAVTATNDPNYLLGRPGQYTSKITFTDSLVPAGDVTGAGPGDVERGGAIEVFANPGDAKTRAAYIRGVTRAMPAIAEYDYVHGTVLVRVSRYLTPKHAAEYEAVLARVS
jgi:hypothetical protein